MRRRTFSQNLENREENEICVSESHQSRREREFCLKNLEYREKKDNGLNSLINREEKLNFFLKILKIENRKRNENPIFSSERENMESFLLEIFRDRDSCQCLPPAHSLGQSPKQKHFLTPFPSCQCLLCNVQ